MKFKNLLISNFKSFSEKTTFDFANATPGLHFITGDNKVEESLGANGSGKSTLWDALYWCLYGKSLRGLRAGNIRSWGSNKICLVRLDFSMNSTEYGLTRTWSPNALKLSKNGKKSRDKTQKEIEDLILLDAESFKHTVLIGQYAQMFFDLPAATKLELFTDILRLQYWLDLSSKASEKRKTIDSKISDLREEAAEVFGKIEELKDRIESLSKSFKKHKKETKDYIASKTKDLKQQIKISSSIQFDIANLEKSLKKLEKIIAKKSKKETTTRSDIEEEQNKIREVMLDLAKLDSDKTYIDKQIDKLNKVKDVCPHCNQKVSPEHIKKEKRKCTSKLDIITDKISDLEEIVDIYREEIQRLENLLTSIMAKTGIYGGKVNAKKSQLQSKKEVEISITTTIEAMKETIADLKRQKNPYKKELKDSKERLTELKEDSTSFDIKIRKLQRREKATEFWMKGFKQIRLMLIEEALKTLEIEVNNNLIQLGLKDWKIAFDVERETTYGTISKGFQVLITSPNSPDKVPWEAWSGGESQRLLLAGTMGLANLILNTRGVSSNIEVWDEPSAHLSESGIEDLLDLLYHRARDLGKQVWLVDHRSLDYGGFESIISVVKDEQGSHLEYQ